MQTAEQKRCALLGQVVVWRILTDVTTWRYDMPKTRRQHRRDTAIYKRRNGYWS